jgi:alpha-D-xyloside xylohydrolase
LQGKPALKEPRFERFPDFGGAPPKGDEPRVQTTHDAAAQRASLASGPLTATLNTGPDAFNIAFEADGKQLTNVGWNSIQYSTRITSLFF